MQPYANLNKRWRSAGVIHKFSPTPKRLKRMLELENDKLPEAKDQEKIGALKAMLNWFGGK